MSEKDLEVTWVEKDVCVCDNCGAYAQTPQNIKHFKTCQSSEAKKWERFYEEQAEKERLENAKQK